jgi:hypothetical protein
MASRGLVTAASVCLGAAITLESRSSSFLTREGTSLTAMVSAEMHQELQGLAETLLSPDNVDGQASVTESMKSIQGKMDVRQAAKAVKHRLPENVQSMIASASDSGASPGEFDAGSMAKARIALNEMVEKAWIELDDKIIECKEYQEMNRATFDQVVTDISRLVEQITDLERVETESLEGISKSEMQIKDVMGEISKETKIYNYNEAKNREELTRRQNDLDVFQFILEVTQCTDATSLIQNGEHEHSSLNETRICAIKGGGHAMCFSDHHQQAMFNQMMAHSSQRQISDILQQVEGGHLPNFLQQAPTTTANPAIAASMGAEGTPVAGADEPLPKGFVPAPFCCEAYGVSCGPGGGGIMCSPTPPDCGLLHDKLSLMWGNYKDKVDELTMEMNKNAYIFEELKITLNDQITLLANTKARFAMMLSEARSNLAADREEVKAKQQQKEDVEKNYIAFMKKCCERVKWIMFQDMCALIVVRNSVLAGDAICPGATIVDCEVDNWVPAKCTVECDDSCPEVPEPSEVYECGGWQTVGRKIVTKETMATDDATVSCGVRCPDLSRNMKCNQKKCPVDCEMSEWSGWSKCTADCEGGVRSRTRSLMVKPKNGGISCNTAEETEACNTMSCDRDCTLASWTDWTPCSVACGGGMQSRDKHVMVPTRGFGKCPKETSNKRHGERQCNTQDCVGDEICVASQDLIIAIDGSGSLVEDPDSGGMYFTALKNYALELVTKYKGEYFGKSAMKVGVILFGNGVIMDDGSISPARNLQALTADMGEVTTAITTNAVRKKGFTNMAQAFALAETMYTQGGRHGAQSALLVLTDGKPSFEFQTAELVEQLDDKGVQRFFVVVSEDEKSLDTMKGWASVPWETNFLHVPGFAPLEADMGLWSQKALTLFCPAAMSMELLEAKENQGGFMLVKDGGYCGERGALLSRDRNNDAEACSFLAQGAGASAFLLGTWFRRGWCYASLMTVSEDQYNTWRDGRVQPACDGGWTNSMIFDFYAMQPISSR